jgi:hypothetical protein
MRPWSGERGSPRHVRPPDLIDVVSSHQLGARLPGVVGRALAAPPQSERKRIRVPASDITQRAPAQKSEGLVASPR